MQIQYNITRIEEWCKSHDMPEGTLQLEHLMQATKLLQLKKATTADIEIIYDVCWMLSPMQIQRMCANYHVADYEVRPAVLVLSPCACSCCTFRRRSRRRSCAWSRRK
jgi:myosin heavy subunit